MSDITFFPVGNADTCLLTADDGSQLLFDFASPKNQGDGDKRIDLAQHLRSRLADCGRDHFNVVSFSHLDTDHFAGASEFFYLEHAKKYQGEGRIHIKEMWVPAAAILESRWEQSEEGRIVQAEARHRLKEGKGIRVISEPKALDKWLSDAGVNPDERRELIVRAGNCMPGFNLDSAGAEIFVHSPFSYQHDGNNEVDRNSESSVFHLTLKDGTKNVKVLLTADAPYEVLEDIVKATEKAGNADRLEWDLIKVPHHCSYRSLGPDKGDKITEPSEKVARLYEHYSRDGAVLVSPSQVIPESDEIQPPHAQAAEYYRKVSEAKKGQFKVTMEHPTQEDPKPMEVEVRGLGLGATVVAGSSTGPSGSHRMTQNRSPRAGRAG